MSETKGKQRVLELLLVEDSVRVLVRNFEKLLRSPGSSNSESPYTVCTAAGAAPSGSQQQQKRTCLRVIFPKADSPVSQNAEMTLHITDHESQCCADKQSLDEAARAVVRFCTPVSALRSRRRGPW